MNPWRCLFRQHGVTHRPNIVFTSGVVSRSSDLVHRSACEDLGTCSSPSIFPSRLIHLFLLSVLRELPAIRLLVTSRSDCVLHAIQTFDYQLSNKKPQVLTKASEKCWGEMFSVIILGFPHIKESVCSFQLLSCIVFLFQLNVFWLEKTQLSRQLFNLHIVSMTDARGGVNKPLAVSWTHLVVLYKEMLLFI